MAQHTIAILITIALSAVGVGADIAFKLASSRPNVVWNRWFLAGVVTYSLTAFGWVFVMKHLKLTHVGVYYCSATLLLLVIIGVFGFQEKLRISEVVGVAMALGAIVLLARLA